jgi:hypothetical protein
MLSMLHLHGKHHQPNVSAHGSERSLSESGKQPRSFAETVSELLKWQRRDFKGKVFDASQSEGKEEIKKTFLKRENFEDRPERMISILDFITSQINIGDNGRLHKRLKKLKSAGSITEHSISDEKLPPSEMLRRILTGLYDENINPEVATRGQLYTIALYLYMNATEVSTEEMAETFSKLIAEYDDPRASRYEYGILGLHANPRLAVLCTKAIKKLGLATTLREKFRLVLAREKSRYDDIYAINARLVIPKDK